MKTLEKEGLVRIIVLLEPSASLQDYESKYLPLLTKYLDPDDYDISVIGSRAGMKCFSGMKVKKRAISFALSSTSGVSLVIGYALYLAASFIALMKETKRTGAQILMSLGGHSYSGLLVTIVGGLLQRKSIVRFAGPTRETIRIRYKIGFLYSALAKVIEDWVFPRCSALVSNSPISVYMDKKQVHTEIISQGVDIEKFRCQDSSPYINVSPGLITIARLSKEKRILNIIKSLLELSGKYHEIRLDIIGDGPERENLESISSKLGLNNKVKFHGYIKQSDLPSLMSSADVFILPSAKESLPSAMLEAMACQIPVIASKRWIDNLLEFKNRENVLTCDGSPEGIADAVIEILDDDDLRRRLIRNAYQTIESYHTIDAARFKFRKMVAGLLISYETQ